MRIPDDVLREVYDHVAAEYPNEGCGAVWRVAEGGQTAWEVMRCTNIQDELHAKDPQRYPRTARSAYTIAPKELLRIVRRADEPEQTLVAFYHSHPDVEAYFSAEDLRWAAPQGEASYPSTLFMVVSVREGEARDHRCFAWDAAAAGYKETPC